MTNPHTWTDINFTSGNTITETNLDNLMANLRYLLYEIQNEQDHDGTNYPEIVGASSTVRGGNKYLATTSGQIATGGGTGTVYLTENGLSGGVEIFEDSNPALVMVYRMTTGSATSTGPGGNNWTTAGFGNQIAGIGNYTFEYDPSTAGHPVTITNRDNFGAAFDYLVIAIGPGA